MESRKFGVFRLNKSTGETILAQQLETPAPSDDTGIIAHDDGTSTHSVGTTVHGVVGRPWVCFAVVWWVGHSFLLCCVLLLILNLNLFLVYIFLTFSQHEWCELVYHKDL